MKSFETWMYEDVEDAFGITALENMPILSEWLAAQSQLTDFEHFTTEQLKKNLKQQANNWNEDELKMFFIGPLINTVQLQNEHFKPFTQRSFSASINGIEVGGRVDFIIAKGKRRIKQPFFCIHEYKQEAPPISPQTWGDMGGGDALGQLLITMVAAQALNEKEMPILGTYVIGRNWFFVVLVGKEYAVSNEYNASDDDIFQIFAILQKAKEIMMRYV